MTKNKKWIVVLASVVFFVTCWGNAESVEVHLAEGPHSCVFLTTAERDAARQRADSEDWAREIKKRLIADADALAAEPLDIPHAGGQWTHWYSCQEDGAGLEAKSPTQHVCPKCGKVYTGFPYDQVYVSLRHGHWLRGIATLGWAYSLDPKPEYAARVRSILLKYASFYRDLEIHDKNDKKSSSGARLYAQTLDEATTLCRVCLGYDRVYDAPCFAADDHKRIEEGFLRPACDTIMPALRHTSNWQSWHNAAVGCIGFVLRDKALVDWAVNGPCGFCFQMEHSVLSSGMWHEGAPSYHWYALAAHLYLTEAAKRAGMDLYSLPPVKKMFDGPIRLLFPDQTFPAINDSDRSSIAGSRPYYEIAYRRYQDPNYLALLEPRDSPEALFWGADLPAETHTLPMQTSSNSEADGIAILRDADNHTALFFDYSANQSGHAHPAKLGMILFAQGDERLVDPGRLRYGNPMHGGWYRQTIAHNTVVINEARQGKVAIALKSFGITPTFSLARATFDTAKKSESVDRTVLLFNGPSLGTPSTSSASTIVDVVRCQAKTETLFDLPAHFRGALCELPKTESLEKLSDAPGYCILKNVKRCTEPLRTFSIDTGGENRIHVQVFGHSEAFIATGLGYKVIEELPMVLCRQRGTDVTFVTAYEIGNADDDRSEVTVETDDTVTVQIGETTLAVGEDTQVVVGTQRFHIGLNGAEKL